MVYYYLIVFYYLICLLNNSEVIIIIHNCQYKNRKILLMKKNIKIYQNKILAERFRILMGKHQITLKDISDATGCAISTVSTWRRGRPPRNKNIIKKISKIFKVSPDYLLGNSQEVFSNEKSANLENSAQIKDIEKKIKILIEHAQVQPNGLKILNNCLEKISKKFENKKIK
ncbi:MAG: hypothetical protein E7036_00980 [Opitutales bacterium]|nr:hypothetical protein [Opitutales bacterium]